MKKLKKKKIFSDLIKIVFIYVMYLLNGIGLCKALDCCLVIIISVNAPVHYECVTAD